jgi:amino acid adenylation domain-containing protein
MLHSLFRTAAVTWSSKAAVVDVAGGLSYAELHTAAGAFASFLRRRGAKPGDRVALLLPNGIDAAIAIWGTLEAGCVIVPLHASLRGDALVQTLRDADVQWLVPAPEACAHLSALDAAGLAIPRIMVSEAIHDAEHLPPGATADVQQLGALIYTSGSTGEPKGVMLSHANMIAAIGMVNGYLRLTGHDIIYSPLPLSSSYGLYQLLLGLSIGATVVLDRSFAFPVKSLSLIAREKATVMAAVPTMLGWMANSPALAQHDLASLRLLTSAAAALPPDHALKLRQRLPTARLFVMYGQTECKRISWLDPEQLEQRPGSVGRGMAGQEHRVVDAAGLPAKPGEPGELQVRGPHVMSGYWQRPQESALKLQPAEDGGLPWLKTGDLFTVDAEGYLFFVGRSDEILKIGGHKVSPTEIENVLCQIPGVLEAAVTGMPDSVWGEAAVAHLVKSRDSQLTEEDVKRYCSQHLRGFMVPRVIRFEKELPKTASGKTLKRQLGAQASRIL